MGYLSGDTDGRYSEYIRKERNDAKLGKQTMKQAQENIDELYKQWEIICGINPDNQSFKT